MDSNKFYWCSFPYIPYLKDWFENTFCDCCMQHDIEYIENTRLRGLDKPPLISRYESDMKFFKCQCSKGFWGKLAAPISLLFVRLFYWPNRIRKYLLGKVEHI